MNLTLKENYVLSAHAKGKTTRINIYRHGHRPSILTLVTVIALSMGSLIAGVVVIEYLFAIPGIGRRILTGIFQRDMYMVQGIAVLITVVYVFVNTVADIVYTVIDPRIRRTG